MVIEERIAMTAQLAAREVKFLLPGLSTDLAMEEEVVVFMEASEEEAVLELSEMEDKAVNRVLSTCFCSGWSVLNTFC